MLNVAEPRWLNAEQTACYISVRIDALRRLVKAGKIPAPDYTLGSKSPRWDRCALDAAFLRCPSTNADQASKLNAERILQGRAHGPLYP
jgi:hypothetical protein